MTYFNGKDPKELKTRVKLLYVVAALGIFALAVRFWQLQVMEEDYFTELSQNNRIRLVKSTAPRGLIYDRNGYRVVENRPGFDLLIVPEDVSDWDHTKKMLGRLVGLDPSVVDKRLEEAREKKRPPFRPVKLQEDMTWEETVKVESFKFEMPGVILEVAPKRSYIYGTAFSHLIGYLGEIDERELARKRESGNYSLGDLIGKYGIERSFEEHLRGLDGGKEVEVDAIGRVIKVVNWTPPYPGDDITLTLDLKTQLAAWSQLQGKAGAVVAIEPSTGRILAMVSTPSFDPNKLSSGLTRSEWIELVENPMDILTNRATQGQYPPASTFKPIAAAAALEEGVIRPDTEIFSGGAFRFAGRDYRDWRPGGHGEINVHRAIVESSDTFFYQVGLELGVDPLAKHSRGFGLGSETGIGIINEKKGLVPSSDWKKQAIGERWYKGETISVVVGQGYTLATPLQLCLAYSAIANGGAVLKPQAIERITSADGTLIKEFSPAKKGSLGVSRKTLRLVRNALVGVVNEEGGTAYWPFKWSDLKVAGKTGTAQVTRMKKRVDDIEEIPYKFRDHAWFVGYAPYDDPAIAVAVLVEHGGFGATAAAPVAREVMEVYLSGLEQKTDEARIEKTSAAVERH